MQFDPPSLIHPHDVMDLCAHAALQYEKCRGQSKNALDVQESSSTGSHLNSWLGEITSQRMRARQEEDRNVLKEAQQDCSSLKEDFDRCRLRMPRIKIAEQELPEPPTCPSVVENFRKCMRDHPQKPQKCRFETVALQNAGGCKKTFLAIARESAKDVR
ncbi:hypothetical protein DIPPA_05894 [Diplonema papillatum]|nr:hypothetical protein DIPPA_05894 [Diplonema papillatum]